MVIILDGSIPVMKFLKNLNVDDLNKSKFDTFFLYS
jgi:hypothetical protein